MPREIIDTIAGDCLKIENAELTGICLLFASLDEAAGSAKLLHSRAASAPNQLTRQRSNPVSESFQDRLRAARHRRESGWQWGSKLLKWHASGFGDFSRKHLISRRRSNLSGVATPFARG